MATYDSVFREDFGMRTRKKQRIRGLDSLRAIAVLEIVLFHASKRIFPGGYLGVCFFLTLSGFLLMTRELQRRAENEACAADGGRIRRSGGSWIGAYFVRRAQRIYPELMLVLAVTAIGAALLAPGAVLSMGGELVSTIAGAQNWWRIRESQSYFSAAAEQDPFGHLWYLSLQWQLYLVFPLILMLYQGAEKVSRRFAVFLMTLITLVSMADMPLRVLAGGEGAMTAAYYATDARAFSFLAGCTMAAWLESQRGRESRNGRESRIGRESGTGREGQVGRKSRIGRGDTLLRHAAFWVALISQMILLMTFHGERRISYFGGMQLATWNGLLLIGLVQDRETMIGRRLDRLPLRWIGQLSYEMYLVHVPVLLLTKYVTRSSSTPVRILAGAVSALTILLLSLLLHKAEMRGREWHGPGRMLLPAAEAACMLLACGVLMHSAAYQDHRTMVRQMNENSRMLAEQRSWENAEPGQSSGDGATDFDESEDTSGRRILAVGDSVMLGAADALQHTFQNITVDASEGRQEHSAIPEVADLLGRDGQIDTVILALGTNGYFTESDGQKMIDEIGKDRDIYWVTVYNRDQQEFQDSINGVIEKLAAANPNVHAVAWDKEAPLHDGWFWEDGIHLDTEGQKGYADYIRKSLE